MGKHDFCRQLSKLATRDAKRTVGAAERKAAWVYGPLPFGQFEWHGPGGYYWHGQACCKWHARALGWQSYLESKDPRLMRALRGAAG